MKFIEKRNRGFLALFSVVIISFILLSAAVTLNFSGFFGRFNILDSESKERSSNLASSCVNQARLILTSDSNFTGTGQIKLGKDLCNYEIFSGGKIIAWSIVNNAHTYYQAKVDLLLPKNPLISFEECNTLNTCP